MPPSFAMSSPSRHPSSACPGGPGRALLLLALGGSLTLALGGCSKPNTADLRRLGDHYLESGLYPQAVEQYAQYVEQKPGEPDVRANYGRALLGVGRNLEASDQLQIAYSQRPDDEKALDALIDAYLKSNQQDAAIRLLKTNVSDRGEVRDHLRLGRAALRMGDTDTAKLGFVTAAKVDQGQTVDPQLGLVDYYLAVQDKVNAERRLRMAYYIAPQNIEVQNRIRAMKPILGPTFALAPEEAGG